MLPTRPTSHAGGMRVEGAAPGARRLPLSASGRPVCAGVRAADAGLRALPAGILPRSWSHYTVPAGMTVIQWVSDFSERIKQLQNISQAAASGGAKELKVGPGEGPGGGREQRPGSDAGARGHALTRPPCPAPQNIHVCLGGLFVPEAYITATRQYVAQANSWSLEELCLEVSVTALQNAALDACSFGVTGEWAPPPPRPPVQRQALLTVPPPPPAGLKLQGATCSNNKLSLSNAISTALPLTQLRWVKQTNAEKKANVVGDAPRPLWPGRR